MTEAEQRDYVPKNNKKPSEEEEERKKKVTPGSLMKAIVRPGGGDAKPVRLYIIVLLERWMELLFTPRNLSTEDWTGLNFQSIMDEADKIKNTGNRLFKEGKYELAKAKYEKVLREYNHVNPQDDEEGKMFLNSGNSLT